jgi:hypothetical protein
MLTNADTAPKVSSLKVAMPHAQGEIVPVSKREAGQVLTSHHIGVETALTLLPIATGMIGGFGGLGLALYLSGRNVALAWLCGGAGAAIAVASVVVLLRFQQFLPSRYLWWVVRRSIARRVDPLVSVNDTEVEFVDIVPRSHWGKTMLEPATDTGLFRIDHARRELLLEGDQKRYRIPFAAVTDCHVEEIRMDADEWGNDLYYVTLLIVETATGPREIPLAGRHLRLEVRRMPQRCRQAQEFCARILMALAS